MKEINVKRVNKELRRKEEADIKFVNERRDLWISVFKGFLLEGVHGPEISAMSADDALEEFDKRFTTQDK